MKPHNKRLLIAGLLALLALQGCQQAAPPMAPSGTSALMTVLPPAYLQVAGFQRCLGEQTVGTHRQWCLPVARPVKCPEASWQQLNQLQGRDRVPAC